MRDFFYLKYKIDENNGLISYLKNDCKKVRGSPSDFDWIYIPCALDFRYKFKDRRNEYSGIRYYFRSQGFEKDKEIFGYANPKERNSSKVYVSHLYKEDKNEEGYFLKIWGVLPRNLCNFDAFVSSVKNAVPKEFKLIDEKNGERILGDKDDL